MESGFVEVEGGEMYFETEGEGRAVILLHAGVADSRMWDKAFAFLAQSYCVVRCDLRGHGQSLLPNDEFAPHDDVKNLMDGLRLGPSYLVGASYGAGVAIDFALSYPHRVLGLVLCAPSVGGHPASETLREHEVAETYDLKHERFDEAVERSVRMWVDGPRRGPDDVNAEVRKRVAEMQEGNFKVPVPAGVATRELLPPAIERLGEIDAPALVLIGELDLPEMVALSEQVAAEIPGCEREVVAGAAHMLAMEQPHVFRKTVAAKLAEWDRRSGAD